MSTETRTMQPIGPRRRATTDDAGLVLLYAEPFESLPPAVPLSGELFVVGREPLRGGLRLDLPSVSRMHAKLTRHADGWEVADLGSRNGTFVDGRRIGESTLLQHGAEIRIGDALFKFVTNDVGAYVPYCINGAMAPGARRLSSAVPGLLGGLSIDRVAAHVEAAARADLPVLVVGETGTGKELVSRAIHRLGGRGGSLCAVNCAAIPSSLFESELFGARKGAYTGAERDKDGLVKAADGGTLFLDEVGELPLDAQAKLLRVLETKEVRPLGATHGERVDVRLVCATHRDLASEVAEGRFRGDLLARLAGYTISLPPLRAHKEDLYLLIRHFLQRAARPDLGVSFGFMVAACDYDWPFNVRECQSAVLRAAVVADEPRLEVRHLPEALRERASTYGVRTKSAAEPAHAQGGSTPSAEQLRSQLERHRGNVAAVARELGKDRKQVHRWMRRLGIAAKSYRG